ncbi:hypothetical protein CTEN210_07648 [Chaetoceros tenuissimus]|uniref:Uncharacterized protein n=1 Tax=Chaetoceros tenuissimus TaxID=426638 RepID=A0AAD3CSA6_9STRA|nr:hypothetical protein CTEN210_07648 [Chaetoceros tenuissimus]
MHRLKHLQIIVVCLLSAAIPSYCFSSQTHVKARGQTRSTSSQLYAQSSEKATTTLHFKGNKVFKTDPIPLKADSIETLFVSNLNGIRKLLLSGSGNNKAEILSGEESNKLMNEWKKQTLKVGASTPDAENHPELDVICRVNTSGINFVGLEVKSDALIGTKLVLNENSSPEIQLVFIKDSQYAEGPKILVWIFNKLTGKDDKKAKTEKEQMVTSFSKFYATSSNEGEEISLVIETSLDIAVQFPKFLLKILPVSKEKAEEQGSNSILKTLDKDTGASLKRIEEYFRTL